MGLRLMLSCPSYAFPETTAHVVFCQAQPPRFGQNPSTWLRAVCDAASGGNSYSRCSSRCQAVSTVLEPFRGVLNHNAIVSGYVFERFRERAREAIDARWESCTGHNFVAYNFEKQHNIITTFCSQRWRVMTRQPQTD